MKLCLGFPRGWRPYVRPFFSRTNVTGYHTNPLDTFHIRASPFPRSTYSTFTLLKSSSGINQFQFSFYQTRRMKSTLPITDSLFQDGAKNVQNKEVDFSKPEIIYQTKRTSELFRGLLILQLSGFDAFAQNSINLMTLGQRLLGKRLFDAFMRRTFFGQFAIEEERSKVEVEKKRLEDCGIASIFAVTAEEDVGEDINYYNEARYDRNFDSMMLCLDLSNQMCTNEAWPKVTQLKVTSYIKADVLAKVSYLIERVDGAFKNPGTVSLNNIESGLNGNMEVITELSDAEMTHIRKALIRVNQIAQKSHESNIHLLVDAEKENINPCMSLIAMAMMKKFNKSKAMVWNTYQCYLKTAEINLTRHVKLADEEGFCFGVKLVRGAYMDGEAENARSLGQEVPLNPSYEATNTMYNNLLEYLIRRCTLKDKLETRFILATHNEESILMAVSMMKELGLPSTTGKVIFGQLYGMCDHISFALGQAGYFVYKSIVVGSIEDVLLYLSRRAQENNTVFHRLQKEKYLMRKEIWRRISSSSKNVK